MDFTEETLRQAFRRSEGRCECKRGQCGHPGTPGRCTRRFNYNDRARSDESGWQANHIQSNASGGSGGLANCEILCVPCHKKTKSYGSH